MRRRLKLLVEYDGADFFGWQLQARTGERTVQGALQAAFARLPGTHGSLRAAGRTDAGVHALGMVAHVDTDTPVPEAKLLRALNAHLPPDVRVLAVARAPDTFEAQYGCRWRYYRYRLRLAREDASGAALLRGRALFVYAPLDAGAMREAAPLFMGHRDFAALATQETRGTVRTVHWCELAQDGSALTLHIAADGFLRGMVRAVVGTLLAVGAGKVEPQDIPALIASGERSSAGENAPPHGLYFVAAGYEAWRPGEPERLRELRPEC
jgi:tRNA pseudouridine38-40 synthase